MKKLLISSLLVSFLFTLSISITGIAADEGVNYEKAVDLKILGLFLGSGSSFELNRAPTRAEGANMLVRLLGKDQEAKTLKLKHPFTDVPKSSDYQVGYLYHNNLTLGKSKTTFGSSDKLTVQQYVTFVLRAFGYSDKNGDFTTATCMEKAYQVGLLSDTEAKVLIGKPAFLRDDLVGISYNALKTKLKDSNLKLLDKLVTLDKAVSQEAATTLGLYVAAVNEEIGGILDFNPPISNNGYVIKDSAELTKLLRKVFYLNETTINIDTVGYTGSVTDDFKQVYKNALATVTKSTGVENFFSGWSWDHSVGSSIYSFTLKYNYTPAQFLEIKQQMVNTIFKARHIVLDITKPGMSEYEKELAIHKYIIDNCKYDYKNYFANTLPDTAFTSYGCLMLKSAVCEGYSEAVKLLCDLSNIECMVVKGEANYQGNWDTHAWNILKIGGKYYHLDTAFDDPVSFKDENLLTYYHFNLMDTDMTNLYTWNAADYPKCTSTESNYYYKSKLTVNLAGFNNYVLKAIREKKASLEVRITDYKPGTITNPTKIILDTKKVSSLNYSINQDFGIIRIFNIKYW